MRSRNVYDPRESEEANLSHWMDVAGDHPLLTAAQEQDLTRRWRAGDEAAREELVRCNQKLVIGIAGSYVGRGLTLGELISEGNIGLLRCLDKYDPDKGHRLSTYATWWIKQACGRAVAEKGTTIRVPVHVAEKRVKMTRFISHYFDAHGHHPTIPEIAAHVDASVATIQAMLAGSAAACQSLDAARADSQDDGDPLTLAGIIPSGEPSVADQATCHMLRQLLEAQLDRLEPRERLILRLRYGMDDDTPQTLEAVGAVFGITRERIRQIEAAALRKLRHPTRAGKLRAFLAND